MPTTLYGVFCVMSIFSPVRDIVKQVKGTGMYWVYLTPYQQSELANIMFAAWRCRLVMTDLLIEWADTSTPSEQHYFKLYAHSYGSGAARRFFTKGKHPDKSVDRENLIPAGLSYRGRKHYFTNPISFIDGMVRSMVPTITKGRVKGQRAGLCNDQDLFVGIDVSDIVYLHNLHKTRQRALFMQEWRRLLKDGRRFYGLTGAIPFK